MKIRKIRKSIQFLILSTFSAIINIYAGEYPRTLTAYLGTSPVLDGFIAEGEYADAEFLTGVDGWFTDTGVASKDSLDLSVKVWYKHDGTYLYFAFDVCDNIIYGIDTERWLPEANSNANSLERGVGWPYFGDGLEIMMNASYAWDDTKKSIGDGTIWQTICNSHKSTAGGLEYGGLIEGVPYTEYAWTNYREWYLKEYMKAKLRIKTKEEGSGYVVEWRISPNPCMQIDENTFVDLSKENKVGINIEFEDLDNKEDGNGSGNLTEFCHVDYMAKVGDFRKNVAKSFATLILSPEKMNPDSLSSAISENYESSLALPASHIKFIGTGNDISVQTNECQNNKLVINKVSQTDSTLVDICFLWIDKNVYSSFDITPEQTFGSINFELMSEEKSAVKISFEDGSIRYYQNGSSTAWKLYEADTNYRVQVIAYNQGKKYTLDVNGDVLIDLDFHDATGISISRFRIHSPVGSSGIYLFDNLIIQDELIILSDLFPFEDCDEHNTSIEADVKNARYNIYPNPTSGSLTIELDAPHPNPIIVTDMFGHEIHRVNGAMTNKIEIHLPVMASGIYLVNFNTEHGRQSRLINFLNLSYK